MILGIGTDTIEIERFALWSTYSRSTLARIFSSEEIDYCLMQPNKSAERFAARFAAREAFYKAFSYAYSNRTIPFLAFCRLISIIKKDHKPYIFFNGVMENARIHLSWSHSRNYATAFVIIETL